MHTPFHIVVSFSSNRFPSYFNPSDGLYVILTAYQQQMNMVQSLFQSLRRAYSH